MKRKIIIFSLTIVVVIASVFIWSRYSKVQVQPASDQREKVRVMASFYPLAHFAEQIGGNLVDVVNMTPPGIEPHDYEPTPKQIADMQAAQLVLANGSGLDSWLIKMQADLEAKGVKFVDVSQGIQLIEGSDEHGDSEDDHKEEGGNLESGTDPHFWLNPVLAQKEVAIIRDALILLDGSNAETYSRNANSYIESLSQLDTAYRQGLSECLVRTVVTSHKVFGYLAQQYGLNEMAISGLSPEEEPSPQRMAEVAREAKAKGIKYIFFETLVSPKLAETIAREAGAQTLVFNPLEGLTNEEMAQGKNYISLMKENLQNLRTGLQCK